MAPRIIALVNQKGGAGKTTTACNLAACLAAAQRQTLLIDLDAQSNATLSMGINPADGIGSNVLNALKDPTALPGLMIEIEENLHVIPSHLELSYEEYSLAANVGENQIRRAIKPILDDFHYIIFDCPPYLGICTLDALQCVFEVIVLRSTSGVLYLSEGFSLTAQESRIPEFYSRCASFPQGFQERNTVKSAASSATFLARSGKTPQSRSSVSPCAGDAKQS